METTAIEPDWETQMRSQVTEAAKIMDTEVPGWYNLIDLEQFEMASCSRCVLGQVFGRDVENKLQRILGPTKMDELRAINASGMISAFDRGLAYIKQHGYTGKNAFGGHDIMNCLWVEEIASRRAEDVSGDTSNAKEDR